jgi:hypothetical protein
MKAALNKTNRDFVYSLGGWEEWEWGDSIGGNLWRQKDLEVFSDKFESAVPAHGVILVKISGLN